MLCWCSAVHAARTEKAVTSRLCDPALETDVVSKSTRIYAHKVKVCA